MYENLTDPSQQNITTETLIAGHRYKQMFINGTYRVFIQGTPIQPIAYTRITTLKFMERFPRGRLAQIELLSVDDPAMTDAERLVKADLRVWLRMLDNAKYIDLKLPQNAKALAELQALELLSEEEVTSILESPVTEEERYKGEL